VEAGYKLEAIAKASIETERARQDRLESMEKDQCWDKIRSMVLLKSSLFDRKYYGADGVKSNNSRTTMKKAVYPSNSSMEDKSPSKKGPFGNLLKLKRSRSDKLPKCISVSQQG
jgi:hypothetical protein